MHKTRAPIYMPLGSLWASHCEKIYEKDITDKKLKKRFSKGFNAVFTGNISPAQSFETILTAAKILKKRG